MKNFLVFKGIKKLTLAKKYMLDVSATTVAFFSKDKKCKTTNGVLLLTLDFWLHLNLSLWSVNFVLRLLWTWVNKETTPISLHGNFHAFISWPSYLEIIPAISNSCFLPQRSKQKSKPDTNHLQMVKKSLTQTIKKAKKLHQTLTRLASRKKQIKQFRGDQLFFIIG